MFSRGGGRQNHPQITQIGLGPRCHLPNPPRSFHLSNLPRWRHLPNLPRLYLRNLWMALVVALVFAATASAQTKRTVIIKCDGLPYDLVDRFVQQRDKSTGKSALPWIDYIFYQRGARLSSFYVRGMSLSAPSWSLLETGQHLQIKGNVEFDRYTLHSYDYLNFFPVYVAGINGSRIDMPGVEVL